VDYTTLITTAELATHLDDPDWVVVDCRFALTDPTAGPRKYAAGHIPGAIYADLDKDLAAPHIPGQTGRHPLPPVAEVAATFGRWGIDDRVQVVAYDDAGGLVAGRLWWMLRWLGHPAVALLDGDLRGWLREGRPVETEIRPRAPRVFVPRVQPGLTITADEIMARLGDPDLALLDARGRDRFRGENETLDPKAGHIPGAQPAPYTENVDAEGRILPRAALRARFDGLVGGRAAEDVVLYCGSGVSAAHNALALLHAGLGEARLYAGSWSEWIIDSARPIATGDS
jgi:thiosulfate/3-mercaptopyruvate sulfurtransferase